MSLPEMFFIAVASLPGSTCNDPVDHDKRKSLGYEFLDLFKIKLHLSFHLYIVIRICSNHSGILAVRVG